MTARGQGWWLKKATSSEMGRVPLQFYSQRPSKRKVSSFNSRHISPSLPVLVPCYMVIFSREPSWRSPIFDQFLMAKPAHFSKNYTIPYHTGTIPYHTESMNRSRRDNFEIPKLHRCARENKKPLKLAQSSTPLPKLHTKCKDFDPRRGN